MKILYVGTSTTTEFMSDTILHGLRSVLGPDVVDAVKVSHMYTDYYGSMDTLHGHGFTLSKTLKDVGIDRTDIPKKIQSKYFDYVIYGASQREDSRQHLELVTSCYPHNRIVFINGADSWRGEVEPELINLPGIHFLREKLTDNSSYPISFAVPKEIIVSEVPVKEYYLMPLVPGVGSTYIYNTQAEYYDMYQRSMFGLTWKKAGWDCLRHYEILSQGCLPLFLDIHRLPKTLMTTYPRKQIERLLDVAVKIPNFDKTKQFNYDERITLMGVNFNEIEFVSANDYKYYDVANELLAYTKQYLTTEYQAKYVIDILGSVQ